MALTLCSAAPEAAPVTFQFRKREEGSPPCIRGSVFRSSQRQLGLLLASCWGLQVSLSIQRQPRRSCTASTLNIRKVALPGPASCSGLVRWRALRSVITPVAMQMAASIALGCGGKECFAGHERERSRHRFVPVAAFLSSRRGQATDSGRHHVIARQAFPARERPPAVGLGAVGLGAAVPPECDRRPRQANAVLQTVPDKFGLPLRFAALPLRFAARNGAQRKLGRSPQYLDDRLRRDRHPSTVPAD